MSKIYANPFKWGKPVSGNQYISRPVEQENITEAIEKQNHLIITGPRGTGKTSLIKHTLDQVSTASIYLDLSFVVSRGDLINLLLDALGKRFPHTKVGDQIKAMQAAEEDSALAPVFDLLYDQVKQSKRKFSIAWDEFQHLVKLKDDTIDELRTCLKDKQGIAHIFISHREDILHDIFKDKRHHFFKHHEQLSISHIDPKAFNLYLTQRFRRMGLNDFDLANAMLSFTEAQPQLTQQLAHSLAQLWLEGTTTRLLDRSIQKMLSENNDLFALLWDHFGLNEKRLFLGLANGYSHPTELSFIRKFKLSATSTAHNTALKLLREGWLVNRDEGYHIYNPLFLKWLQENKDLD